MPVEGAQRKQASKRKKALSPELREVLHMLKSLEDELGAKPAPAR